jgi:ribose/xylose/arabinose/galactoside ABC-type transport system permease subunit
MRLTADTSVGKKTGAAGLFARLRPFTGVVALVVLCAVFGSREPAFLSPANFFNILNAMAIVGILAVGQAFPLIGGGFDLSQGAVASFSGAVTASMMSRYGMPIPAAVATGLAVGGLLGYGNGILVARVGINPFVATLGTQIAFFGLTNVYTNNQPFSLGEQGAAFRTLSFGTLGPFSYASILFLSLAAALAFVLKLLPFGQHVYTLGGNEEATRLAGIDTVRLKISTYVLSGLMAGTAGLVMIARAGQASPVAGQGYELQSLASCIVGGIALGGGIGSAWNVVLGVLTLGVVDIGLQMAVNAPNWRPVIQGLIILLAVTVDARARARR